MDLTSPPVATAPQSPVVGAKLPPRRIPEWSLLLRFVQTLLGVVVVMVALGASPSFAETASGTLVVKLSSKLRRDDVVIYVDSLPVSTKKVARGLTVALGDHLVEVVWPDGATARYDVEVNEGTERVTVRKKPAVDKAPDSPAVQAGFPIWPSLAATTAAVAGALFSTVFVVSFAQSFLAYNEAVAEAVAAPKEGSVAPLAIVTNRIATKRVALDSDGIASAILVPATVVAAAASVALWVWWAEQNPNSSPAAGE